MKHLFIVNPAAGKQDRSREIIAEIDGAMAGRGEDYECRVTAGPRHAEKLVGDAAKECESLRVYACGGDGTLNETVNGAAGLDNVAVTHYPCGSGNDFIKIFGRDSERFKNLDELINGDCAWFDLIECNGRYGISICSIGFDARIGIGMRDFKRLPLVTGRGAYNLSVIYNVFKGIHLPYKVDIDGREFGGRFTMLVACNGRYYGGGFNPVPESEPDDGLLDFLLVKKVSRLGVAALVAKYAAGRYREIGDLITYCRGKRMNVVCDRKNIINIDGERLDAENLYFGISDRKIRFVFPRGAQWKYNKIKEIEENKSN